MIRVHLQLLNQLEAAVVLKDERELVFLANLDKVLLTGTQDVLEAFEGDGQDASFLHF